MARVASESVANFDFPQLYKFPPMFTLQPVAHTRMKQLESWRTIIMSWSKHTKTYVLSVSNCPIFENKKIIRKVGLQDRIVILDYLVEKGNAEWTDSSEKSMCLVMWNSLDEWAKLVYKWAQSCSHIGNVFTLYDLTQGDETTGEEFHGVDPKVFYRIIATLQSQRLVHVFASSNLEETGVKFLPAAH